MQLVLQPCGDSDAQEHYVDTIENKVPIGEILKFAPGIDHENLKKTFPNGAAVWGVTPGKTLGNKKKWDRMQVGDLALLYRNKRFFFMATVAYKLHSRELAQALWSSKADGSTWEYAFLLSDLEPVEIDIQRFNRAAGYSDDFIVQGFSVLDEEKSMRAIELLELENGHGQLVVSPTVEEELDLTLPSGDLDATIAGSRRREQSKLRKILLGNRSHEQCAICQRSLPVDFLVIGHVRKRNSCSDDMKRDINNVMPVCLLGCDVLFENGYIFVDDSGKVSTDRDLTRLGHAAESIESLVGLKCLAWNTKSSHYFAWHREHRTRLD